MLLPIELEKRLAVKSGYHRIYLSPDGTGDLLLVRVRAIKSGNSDTL
jgi:hypothetical protein